MSKTKERTPKDDKAEKKRKRQEEGDDAPKKSKKSRKSEVDQDVATPDEPIAEEPPVDKKAAKEEKKRLKRERKEKAAAESSESNGEVKADDSNPLDNDVPMPDATDDAALTADKKKSKKEKKDKKEKKSKKAKDTSEESALSEDATAGADAQNGTAEDDAPVANGVDSDSKSSKKDKKKDKKEKKEKKEKKDKKDKKSSKSEAGEEAAETNGAAPAEDEDAEDDEEEAAAPGKKGRFIVFVGNLPYSATKESISEHFAKLHPTDIRLRTYKGTEKFMGTCFVEFDRFDRMETCLKKYHHSIFPDGKTKEGRKINIELSAGGGGNSEVRKSKITAKNDKLHDERANDREKRAELEIKQSERKEKKAAKGKKGGDEDAEEDTTNAIHPARLAMMQAPAPQAPIHRPAQHRQRY